MRVFTHTLGDDPRRKKANPPVVFEMRDGVQLRVEPTEDGLGIVISLSPGETLRTHLVVVPDSKCQVRLTPFNLGSNAEILKPPA